MDHVLLFNPRSAATKPRLPNSILSVGAALQGRYDYVIVDGNMEQDPQKKILALLESGKFNCFGCTVMPGPQLRQVIPISKAVRQKFPGIKIVWGGYFPSNQPKAVLESGFVDAVINGMGDKCFTQLLDAWKNGTPLDPIPNLIYLREGAVHKTKKDEIYEPDELPALDYDKLNEFYPVQRYLGKTYLGKKTIAYHSSFGCPFTCSFCAVVPIYSGRWKGRSAPLIHADILHLKNKYGGDAIEFHDNNFFVSEKRVVEFSKLIGKEKMVWWGEGRIDTIDKYSDDSLRLMRDAGCRMIFFGAETGNDALLKAMDKGGTQSGAQIQRFAERMAKFDIIPEYSFVLGTPAGTPGEVMRQIDEDIAFIKKIKAINPRTEIIIYVYSPVPTEGSELYRQVLASGFRFPEKLEDWIAPEWENFDLRKNPLTPWLTPAMVDKIKNFETVLNGYYPTVSDIRLSPFKRKFIRSMSALRYKSGFYNFPYELKALQKFWKYRQPEVEGF
jgi:radical SAM superfamily enzyme YgiQ (UPF0313 family)